MFTDFGKITDGENRVGEDRRRMGPSPHGCEVVRRNRWGVALAGVLAIGGVVAFTPTAHAQGSDEGGTGAVTLEFRGSLTGDFSTVAPPPLLTLADSVSGNATVLGKVTGSFTVTIDFNHPVATGFVLVTKTGSLVAADGDRVDLAMVGTFDVTTFDVHYVFFVTGGTGRFKGATGIGTWHVPPPAVFDPATGEGSGSEFFDGVITLPQSG
jgi:hypothetical protein